MKNNKKVLNILGCIIGATLILSAIIFMRGDEFKGFSGITIGIGSGLLGLCIGNSLSDKLDGNDPNRKKLREIEINDERNILIRQKSLSKSHTTMTYLQCLAVFIFIIIDVPLSVLLIMAGLLIADVFLNIFYFNYYNKRI